MTINRTLATVVPAVRLVNEKQTSVATITQRNIGRPLSVGGESVGLSAPIVTPSTSLLERPTTGNRFLWSQVPLMNKHLNDSGQPSRFRMDPNSADKLIQEINPATGEVVGEYSVSTFPALAKSLGLVGSLANSRA